MRKLKTKDLGLFSKIVSKMGIRDQVVGLFTNITDSSEDELLLLEKQLGMELTLILFENYWKAEKEFFELLSNLSEKKIKEIEELSPVELVEMLKEFSKDESIQSFFKLVA